MQIASIDKAIELAYRQWPNLEFKIKSPQEASSACPFCGQATIDGFLLFDMGNFWCRKCNVKGWVDNESGLTQDEIRLRMIEVEQRRQAREIKELKRRQTALEQMMKCQDHIKYHKTLKQDDLTELWRVEGFTDQMIDDYLLGICYDCPTAKDQSSLTIPVFNSTYSNLLNIRHRLIGENGGNRYRPHLAGLGIQLFNSRWVNEFTTIAIVEGAKKSIITSEYFIPSCGIFGANGFNLKWLKHFYKVIDLYLAFDPDALKQAWILGYKIKELLPQMKIHVVTLPLKIDDMFVKYGCTQSQMQEFFALSNKIQRKKR